MDDSYMLDGEAAKALYDKVKGLPIYDYHCHLVPEQIYLDRRFNDIGELWLEADHYKWRVMREFGIDEKFITGDATNKEKFFAFAEAIEHFIGNPVYHWVHLELKQYFGICEPLSKRSAERIWNETLAAMADGSFSARRLIARSNVETVVTTDDPTSDLAYHKLLAKEERRFKVLPCIRTDRALAIEKADFADYMGELSRAADSEIGDFKGLVAALESRLDFFKKNGCPAMDVSFEDFAKESGDAHIADTALKKALAGESVSPCEEGHYKAALLKELAAGLVKRDMVMQLHTGVVRNVNGARFAKVGADSGIDSISNAVDVGAAGRLFDGINSYSGMPKTIVYTLNKASYYPLASLLGDFAGESRGRMQLGAAWWFMDSRDGIREQLKIFANTLGLGNFNGMLTDSRSFTSYARHDYFRRILCSVMGKWIDSGEYPMGEAAESIAADVCYYNAKRFFGGER